MTQGFDRNQFIQYAIDNGYKAREIDNALKSINQPGYNPLTYSGNYKNLPANFSRNAKEFARDFKTITGVLASEIMTGEKGVKVADKFKQAINSEPLRRTASGALVGGLVGSGLPVVGTLGGAVLGGLTGLVGGPKNMADAYLSTYDTSIDDIRSGKTKPMDIVQGAFNNPMYAAADILSVPGIANATGKAIKSGATSVTKNAPMAIRSLFPDEKMRDLSRSIGELSVTSRARRAEMFNAYNTLNAMPMANRLEIVKDITTNTGKLNKDEKKLSNAIKSSLRNAEKTAIERGFLDAKMSKENTIAQYIMQKLSPEHPELLHGDIVNYLDKKEVSGRMWNLLKDEEFFNKIEDTIKEGSKLYDEGKISFLTQALAPSRDELGQIIASEINKDGHGYFGTKRIIGRTLPEEIANILDDSVNYQLQQIVKPTEAQDILEGLFTEKNIGKLIEKDIKATDIPSDKVAISLDGFKKSIAQMIASGGEVDLVKAFRDSHIIGKGSYLIDKVYADAINNSFKPRKFGGIRKASNAFKKAVLANPHWIVLNRIGNITNNSMAGVGIADYVDAVTKLRKNTPKALRQQTSFNSYVGTGVDGLPQTTIVSSVKQPINQLVRGWNKFKDSNKSLSDIGRFASDIYSSTSNITANPMFRIESELELVDRYANFIHQAKELAKKTKVNYKDIIKKSDTDSKLFNRLNREVNKDLGDYLGRNYALPSSVYDVASELIPFYRFLTQTGRTTAHQLSSSPLRFQSTVMAPSRAGNSYSEDIINMFNLDRNKYDGGSPYKIAADGTIRTVNIEPLPAQTVFGDITNAEKLINLMSPIYSMAGDIARYQKNGRMPTSPNLTNIKLTAPSEAEKYTPTTGERLAYGLNQMGQTFVNPYRLMTIYGPEMLAAISGTGLQSRYDTNPVLQNPLSYKRQTPGELIGKWLSLQTSSNYPKYKKTANAMKKDARNAARNRQKVILLQSE
jgi:hypothetical protein